MVKIILGATIQVILGTEESGLEYRRGRGRDILFVRVNLFQESGLEYIYIYIFLRWIFFLPLTRKVNLTLVIHKSKSFINSFQTNHLFFRLVYS